MVLRKLKSLKLLIMMMLNYKFKFYFFVFYKWLIIHVDIIDLIIDIENIEDIIKDIKHFNIIFYIFINGLLC